MSLLRKCRVLPLLLLIADCDSQGPDGPAWEAPGGITAAAPAAAQDTLLIIPEASTMSSGSTREFIVLTKRINGTILTDPAVVWTSSNSAIATVTTLGAVSGRVVVSAVSAGTVAIKATFNGLTASATVNVLPPPPSAGTLQIDSFWVVEYQYPNSPLWFYAPQVIIRNTSATKTATVLALSLLLPDPIDTSMFVCRTNRQIYPGESMQLIVEDYGDYELAFFNQYGLRASGQANIAITVNHNDRVETLTKAGQIVSGGFPPLSTARRFELYYDCRPGLSAYHSAASAFRIGGLLK
jgi:hypothetical protein